MANDENIASTIQNRLRGKSNEIFSKEALDKMRSPEKLDTVLSITTPFSWMALAAVVVMVLAIVIWSIFGSFTVKAEGMGLIMGESGIEKISAVSSGIVDEVYVHPGSHLQKGELIAHLTEVQASAATRMAQYAPELAASGREAVSRVHDYDTRRYQKESIEYIYSPYEGIVEELLVSPGSMVGTGSAIANVRLGERKNHKTNLKGVLYVPVEKGKRVEKGQTIQLAPGGVDVSQSGSLLAVVRTVQQYPATMQAMVKKLGNEQLAQRILQAGQGAVMEVGFDLVEDPNSESGYLWTSKVGVHKPVTAGSFCTGFIIVERRPPIEKVFYKLSQWLRNR